MVDDETSVKRIAAQRNGKKLKEVKVLAKDTMEFYSISKGTLVSPKIIITLVLPFLRY